MGEMVQIPTLTYSICTYTAHPPVTLFHSPSCCYTFDEEGIFESQSGPQSLWCLHVLSKSACGKQVPPMYQRYACEIH